MSSKILGAVLVATLIAVAPPSGRADEDDDQERAQQERERAEEQRNRERERAEEQRERERERAEEERERQREQREEARQHAEEARQHAEEARQRVEEERQRLKEDKHRAKEGKRAGQDCRNGNCGSVGGKSGRTTAKVKGPVRFQVEVVNADVQVTAVGKDTVSIAAKNCAPNELELDGDGDEFEADFSEWGTCQGPVIVVVPVGSSVEVATVQGNLKLKGSFKDIEASSVAGSIEIDSGDDVEAEAVQGKVKIGSARRVHVESVAGDVEFTTTGTSPVVDVETVNGNVRWTGACGKGCRASVESFQGSCALTLDTKSSFELRFATQSGKFNDQLGAQVTSNKQNVKGYSPIRARYGKAEGTVRVETYQGDLGLKKKP